MARLTRTIVSAPVAVLSAAVLVISGSGLALAASDGALNVPFTGHDNRSERAPEAPAESNPGLDRAAGEEPEPTEEPEVTPSSDAAPSPSLKGLCKAYQAGASAFEKEKLNPAFIALVAAAGEAESVATYCVELVGESRKSDRPAKAEGAGKPEGKGKPEGVGKPEGAGKPSATS